uniref:Uncharacterized protein n=1 Tax=Cacopsylla melanoneura TaxID=428564 RepID=A0A8D8YAH3_9HEMI
MMFTYISISCKAPPLCLVSHDSLTQCRRQELHIVLQTTHHTVFHIQIQVVHVNIVQISSIHVIGVSFIIDISSESVVMEVSTSTKSIIDISTLIMFTIHIDKSDNNIIDISRYSSIDTIHISVPISLVHSSSHLIICSVC